MCFVWISERTGLLPFTVLSDWFLYGITESHCLLHVWTESFNILHATFSIQGHAMSLTVHHPLLTTDARVRSLADPCTICGGQSGTGTGFPPSTCVFSCEYQYYFTNTPYTYSSLARQFELNRNTKGRILWNLSKTSAVSEISEHCMEKYFLVFCLADLRQYLVYMRAP
jgi:hypothetical protein